MIRSSYPEGAIRERLNLAGLQLYRHLENLKRKNPKEAWRYERLLSDSYYHYAWRLNTVINYLDAGLRGREIENLLGIDRANFRYYRDEIKKTVKDPKILKNLERGPTVRKPNVQYYNEREMHVAFAILRVSPKKPGIKTLIRMTIRGAFGHLSPYTLRQLLKDAEYRHERFWGEEKRHEKWRINEITALLEEKEGKKGK